MTQIFIGQNFKTTMLLLFFKKYFQKVFKEDLQLLLKNI